MLLPLLGLGLGNFGHVHRGETDYRHWHPFAGAHTHGLPGSRHTQPHSAVDLLAALPASSSNAAVSPEPDAEPDLEDEHALAHREGRAHAHAHGVHPEDAADPEDSKDPQGSQDTQGPQNSEEQPDGSLLILAAGLPTPAAPPTAPRPTSTTAGPWDERPDDAPRPVVVRASRPRGPPALAAAV